MRKQLLRAVLDLALPMAGEIGCAGVVVDAKPGAVSFYERFGFEPLDLVEGRSQARPMTTAMFLDISKVRAAR